jgi:hypothetical protein
LKTIAFLLPILRLGFVPRYRVKRFFALGLRERRKRNLPTFEEASYVLHQPHQKIVARVSAAPAQ